ncbi:MAG: hypothetical protein ACKVT0_22550 [Planctomycetaceae bacterium]
MVDEVKVWTAADAARDLNATEDLLHWMQLDLTVHDVEVIQELSNYPAGEAREEFALKALRLGVLSLRHARGMVDTTALRSESDRLLEQMRQRLSEHAGQMHDRLTGVLKDYFDPQSGRFPERVERLVRKDGELEQLLRRQLGHEDSELCRTLASHLGEQSPLIKLLNTDQSGGFLAAFRTVLETQLGEQREQVLKQFSLDVKDGALSRFISELTDRQGTLSNDLNLKIDGVVKQFSLDEENSALSRLVRNVEQAQRLITSEFSLDAENSALARLRRELSQVLTEQKDTNQKFQEEVKASLQAMLIRREESQRSTRHGIEFEKVVVEVLQKEAQRQNDIATATGSTAGRLSGKGSKVGDCVIELGPESAAPGTRIVIEAKEVQGYLFNTARDEIVIARENRDAQVGIFIFSKQTAPAGLEPLTRLGQDIFLVWDSEDERSDLALKVGYSLARALCVRQHALEQSQAADFSAIEAAIAEIASRVNGLDEIETWANTIHNNSDKILKQIKKTREAIVEQTDLLRVKTANWKHLSESVET